MNISTSSPSELRWYKILILLPLVILQDLAYGFTTSSVIGFISLIECEHLSSYNAAKVPETVWQHGPPRALGADIPSGSAFMCIVVPNILAILISGLYANELEAGNRKKAMGYAAILQLLSSIWGTFACTFNTNGGAVNLY